MPIAPEAHILAKDCPLRFGIKYLSHAYSDFYLIISFRSDLYWDIVDGIQCRALPPIMMSFAIGIKEASMTAY
jgi:hypothetical protein